MDSRDNRLALEEAIEAGKQKSMHHMFHFGATKMSWNIRDRELWNLGLSSTTTLGTCG